MIKIIVTRPGLVPAGMLLAVLHRQISKSGIATFLSKAVIRTAQDELG